MNSKYLVKNTGTGVTKVNKAGLTLAPACVPRCSLFFAPAACHTCQPQESKGQTNICTHPNSLPTVAELSCECSPSFMRPHTLKLPFLALLNRQVPQALPFLQCKEGTWLWYLSASVFLPQALEVSRWFAEPCVYCWLNPWPISSNLLPFPCPGMETTSRPYL